MNAINNIQPSKDTAKTSGANLVAYIGAFLLLAIFPLYYHNYYFDILKAKYKFYYCTILIMALALLVLAVKSLLKNKAKPFMIHTVHQVNRIFLPDVFMIILLISIIITTLQSDFKYESFWGNESRFNGLFLWLIYGLAYFIITRYLKFKEGLIDCFMITGVLVCLLGITDYFQFDILHFKEYLAFEQKYAFTSTLGNINMYTAYVGMVIATAMTLFIYTKSKKKIMFYYIVFVVGLLALITGRSDNGYLAMGAVFIVMPFLAFQTRRGIKRYLICAATLLTCIWLASFVSEVFSEQVLYLDSAFGMIGRINGLIYGVCLLWIIIALLHVKHSNSNDDIGIYPRIIWLVFVCICFFAVLYMFYDANIAGNSERYRELENYLVFYDSWGTNRGFVWKLAIKYFKEFSIPRKLFGYGADTFRILAYYEDYDTMINYNNTVFESVHNEYLHYLVTIGLMGLLAYLMLFISSCYRIIKYCKENPYALAMFFSVIAYLAQATVNIAQPIVTPIMMTLLMIGLSMCYNKINSSI